MRAPVLVIGAGGHARVVIELLHANGCMVAGLLDDGPARAPVLGCPVLGGTESLSALRAEGLVELAVAIGDNAARARLGRAAETAGFVLPPLLHPSALISPSAILEEGCQIMARAVLGPESRVARMALVNTGAIVEHECEIEEAAHIGPGAVLCGASRIGPRALVAAGAVLRPGVVIGADALVAPGAAVACTVPPGGRYGGVPARPVGEG
ncbi:NeuD/PglB/VioB family sugar acetyltransferase [Roseomonas sp. F4]